MHRQVKFSIWFPIILVAAFAAGYLFWQQTLIPGPYDLEPMPVVRNHRATDADTSNWQTYRNEKYGFEFKYPPEWRADLGNLADESRPSFGPVNPYRPLVQIRVVKESELNSEKRLLFADEKILDERTISISGITVERLTVTQFKSLPATVAIFKRKDLGFIIEGIEGTEEENIPQIFNQILSTFKFIQ